MKKILIINGHPDPESLNFALAAAYKKGALASGAEVREIVIRDLKFDPNLSMGYRQRTELEHDLLEAWEKIQWCEHMVWVHPVWWGGLPAITKGFIDRMFLPGFAFQYRENSSMWDKLLKGRSARIITTLDYPIWYYRFFVGNPSVTQLKKTTLEFCGIKPVKVSYFGPVKGSNENTRKNWLEKAQMLGIGLK